MAVADVDGVLPPPHAVREGVGGRDHELVLGEIEPLEPAVHGRIEEAPATRLAAALAERRQLRDPSLPHDPLRELRRQELPRRVVRVDVGRSRGLEEALPHGVDDALRAVQAEEPVVDDRRARRDRLHGHYWRLAKRRKEDHVADRVAAREEHREPVDPEPEPARRRHPVGERLDEVRVARLGAHVAGRALGLLEPEALGLLVRVVQLREGVSELHPAGEELEALDQPRVVVLRAREGRELERIVVEDRRLHELRLDEVAERVIDELGPRAVVRRVDPPAVEDGAQVGLALGPDSFLRERLDERHALPRGREVDLAAAEADDRAAENVARDASTSVSIRRIVSS